ncbi:MAG: hypothetical protein JXP34_05750 [Planctomycetes bacterium]|nr:hypothetical protein [Planctomycetota bacterium]
MRSAHAIARRTFIRRIAGAACAAIAGSDPRRGADPNPPKLIVIIFGGGTRSSETIADPDHRHIPTLWGELVPRGTLFTNMRVEGKVVHPNSTGSILTGHWEWDDIDWSRPVAHPTIFEIHRRAARAPDTSAWAFVYASILAKAGESAASGFGSAFGANVVEPPTIPRATAARMDGLLARAAASGSPAAEREAIAACARLARSTSRIATGGLRSEGARRFVEERYAAWRAGAGTTSHDAFLADAATACMRTFAPDLIAIAFGEIDCAHYGSWSRYVEAIRRTDDLVGRIWRAARILPAYRDNTLILVLPDHGRELDGPDRWGFIHHSDFYTGAGADEGCRRVWMLAVGPDVEAGRTIDQPVPITAAAATGLAFLGLEASRGAEPPALSFTG